LCEIFNFTKIATSKVNKSVFLIEDDFALGQAVKELLDFNGFDVRWFPNAEKALLKLKTYRPDVIICDLMLPGLSGHDFFIRVRKNPEFRTIPVVMITANVNPDVKLFELKSGVNDFLVKPFKINELLYKIQNILEFKENIIHNEKALKKVSLYKIDVSSFMDKLDEILYDNLNKNNLSLGFVASKLFISRSTLDKKIRLHSNTNFSNYLKNFKLEYAKKIIDLGATNLKEVAMVSGFNSVSYFSTNFNNHFGLPPGKYIKSKTVKK
jgi:CheY-like chemotaxis protein